MPRILKTEEQKERRRVYDREYRKRRRAEDPEFREQCSRSRRKWYQNNKEYYQQWGASEKGKRSHRNAKLKNKFGITLEQYETMLRDQGGCASCGVQEHFGSGWHVDHCHTTGRVRGVLCHPCNTSLGQFKEDPERISKLAAYAEKCNAGKQNNEN